MSSMEEAELRVDSSDGRKSTNSEYFCELCSLDFTTQNELEEHTWSMLHNTNLNRKQGRDCVHSCSLCKQEFVGLLEFTGHLHGDSHQEKLHNWRRDQHREWSPDRRPLSGSPNQMQQSRTAADWSTDDFSGIVDYFSDHSGEVNMGDNWRGNRGPPRDPRDIPSFPGPPSQFGYHYQEQFDRRRDNRDQFQERGYPSWNGRGRGQPREFRDDTPPNPDPEYPELNYISSQENDRYHWRNSDDRQNDRYYGDSGYVYPNDGWRGSYDINPQFRSRQNSQPHHHGNRRHNSNSPHNDSRPKFRSVVGSVVPSRKQNEIRPSSRNTCRKTEGTADSRQKEAPRDKQTQGRSSPSGTKRKGSDDKTPPESSPSGSPSGRNTRKGKPRKLARPVEENKGEGDAGHSNTSPTKDKSSEKMTRKVQANNNKIEIKIRGKEKERAESPTVSQSTVKVTKDASSVESSDSTSKEKTVTKPVWLTKLVAKDDSTSLTAQDTSLSVKGYSSVRVKGDFTSSAKTNFITTAKGESSSALKPPLSVKGDSLSILERGQKSFMTEKDKEDHTKDTNQSTAHSKGNEEQNSTKKETSVPSLDKQNSSKTVNSLPVFSEKDMKSFKLGQDSSLFTREKSELAPNPKDKDESLKTTDKLITLSAPNDRQGSSCFNQNFSSSISENEKEKTLDINVSHENRQNADNLAHSVTTISTMSSLLWEQREEKLRSLLGIKREPKDTESQEDSIPCPVSKDKKVMTESETHLPVHSSIVSPVTTALSVGSVKPVSSRYIPGFSQLSLSRPQCSFVHIDGVQCGSVTWNKYCSYHQRVFKNDEGSTLEQSVTSKASHIMRDETHDRESSPRSLNSRPRGTQIFRPTTPPYKPPERLGVVSGLEEEIGHRPSYSDKYEKEKEKKELSDASNGSVKTCGEIDLNSTSTYTALRAATDASSGNIDLSNTLQGASRGFHLRGSSTDINSDRSIGASTGANTATSVGTSIGDSIDLSDPVPRPRRILALHDTSLDSDSGGPGIDLSGTVPNLEGLLALHGSSTVEAKGGSQIDLSKTVLKQGRSWKHQGLSGDSGSNIDLGSTISNRGSSVSSDSGPNIDLSETVPQPGRSRTPHEFTHFDLKEAHLPNVNPQATASSATSRLKSDVLHPQKHLVKTEPEEGARPSAIQTTEMIDLNFSTKLLGVPHSVVAPFNASNPSPKKPSREKTKSPSEFSTKSSVLSSPRSFAASPPQSPLSSRRVSTTTHLPVDRSPESTISLPSLSLDLSRFNLPPEVRKALAERYSGKKVTSTTSDHPVKPIEGRRSQPLFSEHKTEGSFEPGKKASPLPARLRGRGQRSISLDSPIVRRENLHAEGSSRLGLLERGNIFDVNQFLGRQMNKEETQQTGLCVGDKIPASLTTGLITVPPSTRIPLLGVPSRDSVPTKDNSEELQSRGLIDLSSTSYLEGMSAPSANQGRMAEGLRLTIDNLRSPSRPSVLQSQGLIDLNSSAEYGARQDTAMESPEALPVIKRKRLNTSEDSESVSSLGAEKNVKRSKQEDTDPRADKPVTYRSGIDVQELLSIERDEQNQLQNLHAVQSRLKSVRSQIQKLCTELDSLSSEEQRITLRMGELRNLRLSILENACYERQMSPLPARIETSTRETRTSATQVGRDDSKTLTTSSEPGKLGNVLEKTDGHVIYSSWDNTSCSNDTKSLPSNNRESNMGTKQITSEAELSVESSVCSTAESLMNSSRSCDPPQSEEQFSSVGTATKFVSREETSHSSQPREKVLERLILASKRAAKERKSSSEVELNRGANISEQTSCDLPVDISSQQQGVVANRLDADSGPSVLGVPVILEDPVSLKSSESESSQSRAKQELRNKVASAQTNEQSRKDVMKKAKHFHTSEKALLRKKSFSDINVSKTIEASRKKIQSARENMKRWKQQEDGIDLHGSHEEKIRKHSDNSPSFSSTGSAENFSEASSKDKQGSLPLKIAVRDNPSTRKTTKELKKSSLFNSGKKNTKEWRKNKMDKREKRFKDLDAIPSKRRKIGDTSCTDTQRSAPFKEKTSSKGRNQVVSAAAHTTTADLEGSGTEEWANTEDEIPTRDVDSQSDDKSSSVSSRASHLQMPSSTVESLKKTLLYSKGKKHRGSSLASKFEGHTGAVCGLKVHSGHLFTCSADKTTRSFNIQTGECVKVYQGHHQAVNCIEMSEDKDRLFTGSNDQTVRSYNIKSGVCTHKFTFDGRVMCLHLAFDLLFVGLNTGIVASIDLMTNKLRERFHCHEPRGVSCLTSATEGERNLLCCGSFDSTITIRDYKTGLLIRTFSHHSMTVLCLQVVDHIMYSGSADKKVQAHNLNTGELLRSFHGHTGSVSGLQIVGSVLVTSCLDKLIRCYDLTTGDLLQVYGGQIDMIFSVLVSNGRIFSGGRDGFVGTAKLDLRVYHPCKWENCELNFGVVSHLKNHIREYHVMEKGTVEACHWFQCGHQFSADDDIAAVLKHVLGHVVTRTARKSAS